MTIELIRADELRLVAGGPGKQGRIGVVYQVVPTGELYRWDGAKHSPVSGDGGDTAPLYFDRLAAESPQFGAPAAVSGYTRGAMVWRVTAQAGSAVLTYQSGAPVADGGAGPWPAVIFDGSRYRTVNVLSISGSAITLERAMDRGGDLLMCPYYDAALGQHLSAYGGMALADMLVDSPLLALAAPGARFYSADSARGTWYTTPWVGPFFSPQYWRQYGGLANNAMFLNAAENTSDSSGLFFAHTTAVVKVNAAAAGQGVNLVLTAARPGVARLYVGHTSPGQSAMVTATVGGKIVYVRDQGAVYTQHLIPFAAGNLQIIVTSLSASALSLRISGVHLEASASSSRSLIRPGERILVIGDSWTDPGAQGAEFVQRLRDRAQSLGAAYVASEGVGGTTSDYHLATVSGTRRIDSWLAQHMPTTVVFHSYINDQGAGRNAETLRADIDEIARTCRAAGARTVVMLPGATSSQSQSQNILAAYGGGQLLAVQSSGLWITQALQAELSAVGSFVNRVQKTPGRVITNTTNSADYAASGSAAADPWVAVLGGTSPATITPA